MIITCSSITCFSAGASERFGSSRKMILRISSSLLIAICFWFIGLSFVDIDKLFSGQFVFRLVFIEPVIGELGHVGVYFWIAHEAWVLHCNEKTECSVLHRVRDLPSYGVPIEGFYKWN